MEAFQDFLLEYYHVLKSLHIISFVAWMAGLFYLPRLFVYHAQATVGSELSQTLKVMEYKLLKYIMNPAMIATFTFGILLAFVPGVVGHGSGWFHAKIVFVLVLAGVHGYFAKTVRIFAADQNKKSHKFFRVLNEIPTLCLILIVFFVVMKPF